MVMIVRTFDPRFITDLENYCPNQDIKLFEVQEFYGIHPKSHRATMFSVIVHAPTDQELPDPGHVAEFKDRFFKRTGIVTAVFRFENIGGAHCPWVGIRFLPNKAPVVISDAGSKEHHEVEVTTAFMYGVYRSTDPNEIDTRVRRIIEEAEELFLGYSESEEHDDDILHFDPVHGKAI
jgi:hypothetical protein